MLGVIIAIILVFSALGGGIIYAVDGSLPGDALHSVKLTAENAGILLPSRDAGRAERAMNFADRRVAEILRLAELERIDDLELAVDKYDYALESALETVEAADDSVPLVTDMTAMVAEATATHLSVLSEVYELVPEEARPAIATAMEKALDGYDRAVKILEQLGVDVPPLPDGIREIVGGTPRP